MAEDTQKKDQYHHGDLAAALLCSVEEIVLEKGVGEVSLREAARRAGVSHSAPAHHFRDKEGLLAAFAEQGFVHLAEALTAAMVGAQDEPPLLQMNAIGKAYVKMAAAHPAHYDVMFRSGLDKSSHEGLHQAANATFAVLHERTTNLVEAGLFPGVDPLGLSAFFWSLVHGLASLWVDGSLPQVAAGEDFDDLVEAALTAPFRFAGESPRI